MQVYCPQCNVGYEVDASLNIEDGKKLRCSQCGNVFAYEAANLRDTPPEIPKAVEPEVVVEEEAVAVAEEILAAEEMPAPTVESDDMKAIFARLSAKTDDLFQEEKGLPAYKKMWMEFKLAIGFHKKANRKYAVLTLLLLILLAMYNYRYEIVRVAPFMNKAYEAVHLVAKVPGEGLEFQNIVWKDFDDDFVRKLEVKGFVVNPTAKEVDLPTIHVELLDKETTLLQSMNQTSDIKRLKAGARVAISIIVTKPSPLTKYVYLTFIK